MKFLLKMQTLDMKTKYVILAGIAGLIAVAVYLRSRPRTDHVSTYENLRKQSAKAEKHIRGIMKKSKSVT